MSLNTNYFPGDNETVILAKLLLLFGGSPTAGDGRPQLLRKLLMAGVSANSGAMGDILFANGDRRISVDGTNGSLSILGGSQKANSSFIDLTGENYSAVGFAGITTKGRADATQGLFKILNAPADSAVSATRAQMYYWGDWEFSPVWNNGATTFTGFKLNATDTASAAASLLASFQVGSETKLSVGKDGTFRIYETTDGGANYERLALQHQSTLGRQVQLAAETGGTGADDISVLLTPAGNGALILGAPPDGTVTGGDARGTNAIDLQIVRSVQSQVASATRSVVIGSYNLASGTSAVAIGSSNTAGGTASVALGNLCTTASYYSTTFGQRANATRFGQSAFASGRFASTGDAQTSILVARIQTTDNTAGVELFLDGASASERCTIDSDSTCIFKVYLVARRTDVDGESAAYEFVGCIDNDAGTTALVGAVTKTVVAEDTAAWDADVVADDANDSLKIQVTGENSKTINWVARIELTEVRG